MKNPDIKVNLESLLLGYYIKYDRLLEMANASLYNIEEDVIDVYVDIYDMLKPMYTTEVFANKQYLVTSSVINLAAHIRGYFWSRHRLNTRIFLVYGENTTISHTQFWPSFGVDDHTSMLGFDRNYSVISSQLEMVKILCAYIPEVYFVHKQSDFSMFVHDNITRTKLNHPKRYSIIISKSKYTYQLTAHSENTFVYRPKKYNKEDTSFVVSSGNLYKSLYSNISRDKTLELFPLVNPKLVGAVLAMTGMGSFNLQTMINVSVAFRLINEAISSGRIMNDYNTDTEYLYKSMPDINKYIDMITYINRFRATDILYQYRLYMTTSESNDISWFINLNDPDTVRNINNKYFADNPLDLNNL